MTIRINVHPRIYCDIAVGHNIAVLVNTGCSQILLRIGRKYSLCLARCTKPCHHEEHKHESRPLSHWSLLYGRNFREPAKPRSLSFCAHEAPPWPHVYADCTDFQDTLHTELACRRHPYSMDVRKVTVGRSSGLIIRHQ